MKAKLHLPSLHKIGVHLLLAVALLVAGLISNVLPVAALPRVVSVGVAAQVGTLTSGTPGSVTYAVTVTKANSGTVNTQNNVTAILSVTGLPGFSQCANAGSPGPCWIFSPASLNWAGNGSTGAKSSTLTIKTSATTSAGSTNFTVTSVRSGAGNSGDNASNNGTLTINPPGGPTITFGAAPTPTYPGANFTVSATSNSNGALSYSVVSGPCVVVNPNLGTFSPSGVGTCVIQASTTATPNFIAGSATQSITILAGAAGPASSCPCDLYAKTGTLTLPDATSVNIYGYSATAGGAAGLPGPTLTVNQGEAVNITLHNVNIPNATSLTIAEQALVPDPTGVTAGNSKTYSIPAGVLQPGTYLYEAGLTSDGPRQVAMGLYGALVVLPAGAPTQAYADPNTAFMDQAVLVLSEIDPAFNADPVGFDMTKFAPKYWLINGKGYPNTDPINVAAAGDKVLLRYINAGLKHHSMGLLGLHQSIIATDGKPAANPAAVVAETIPAGSSLDTLVTIPALAVAGTKYAIFDAATHTDNKGVLSTAANPNPAYTPIAFGGMLTFLTVGTAASACSPDTQGPVTSGVTVAPNPTNASPVTLSASISDATACGSNVDDAEYFVDAIGANNGGTHFTVAPAVSVSVSNNSVDTTALASGNHTFYVHGHDTAGNWGTVASVVLNLDKTGPTTNGFVLTPNPTNGTVNVQLQATADDSATGNQNVTGAEYFIDSQPADTVRGTTITVAAPATVVSLNATLLAANVLALADGNHVISVRAKDIAGNWGAFGTINLTVDKTSPTTGPVTLNPPSPTNGTVGVQVTTGGVFYQRIDATITDPLNGGVNSNIVAAEYFIDTVGANGTGGAMIATTGTYNSPTVTVYAAAELYAIAALPQGQHTVYVHGKDAAGTWGATTSTLLIVDKTAPSIPATGVGSIAVTPNPNPGVGTVTLTGTATDPANTGTPANGPASNIVGGEYYIDTDPGVGAATAFVIAVPAPTVNLSVPINVSALTAGNHTVGVRVKDAASNWSVVRTTTITVDRLFASSFPTAGSPYGWSSVGGTAARVTTNTGANIVDAGTRSLAVSISAGASGYVVNNLPPAAPNNANVTSYDARFYVNPNNVNIGTTIVTIFAAMSGNNRTTLVFQVQMQRTNTGQYQVRAANAAANAFTAWVNISATTGTAIEIARNGTVLTLYVGNVSQGTVTVATTNLTAARLGVSAGIPTGNNLGTIYFDGFVSTRTTHVGP